MVDQTRPVNERPGPMHVLVDRLSYLTGTAIELAILQGELAVEDGKKARKFAVRAAFMVVAAAALMISALPVLAGGCVDVLRQFTAWPLWVSAFVVAGVFLALAALLLWTAWIRIKNVTRSFELSRREAATNLNWLRESVTHSRN